MNGDRDQVLGAIRRALSAGRAAGWTPAPARQEPPVPLPRRVPGDAGMVEHFLRRIDGLGDQARLLPHRMLPPAVEEISTDLGLTRGVADKQAEELLGEGIDRKHLHAASTKAELFEADHALVTADFAISATGTVGFIDTPERPRLLSVAPPVQIVLVRASTLLDGPEDALSRMKETRHGVVWITGSSRTADIEGILIRGAHGSKKLIVLVIEDK